jgi:hypothetical protein
LAAQGGTAPYAFEILSGALPAGLSFSKVGGIAGIPAAAGDFDFVVKVTDSAGKSAQAAYRMRVVRSRWLAVGSFESSSSSRTFLYLADLASASPSLAPIDLERATVAGYSPDGRWLSHSSANATGEQTFYVTPITADGPGKPHFLFKAAHSRPCTWGPDANALVCIKQETSALNAEVVVFDMSGNAPGAALVLGQFHPDAHWLDAAYFQTNTTIVFPSADNRLASVELRRDGTFETSSIDVQGAIVLQSPDLKRVIVSGMLDFKLPQTRSTPPSFTLVDLELRTHTQFKSARYWSFSNGLEAAFSFEPAAAPANGGSRSYYGLRAARIIGPVGEAPTERLDASWSRTWQRPDQAWSGRHLAEVRKGKPMLITIGESDTVEKTVAGTSGVVRLAQLSPDGQWLYMSSSVSDNNTSPTETKHWLSHIVEGIPQAARLLGVGFRATDAQFSPDSRRLLLHGDKTPSAGTPAIPLEFHVYDLSDANQIQDRVLSLSMKWSTSGWSPDSSYISFVGADSVERALYVVDALDTDLAAKRIMGCSTNGVPESGCPGGAVFQP